MTRVRAAGRLPWETWQIERDLRDRFGWGVKQRPVLNRHARRKARKVRRG